jgi:hypothetical protein
MSNAPALQVLEGLKVQKEEKVPKVKTGRRARRAFRARKEIKEKLVFRAQWVWMDRRAIPVRQGLKVPEEIWVPKESKATEEIQDYQDSMANQVPRWNTKDRQRGRLNYMMARTAMLKLLRSRDTSMKL